MNEPQTETQSRSQLPVTTPMPTPTLDGARVEASARPLVLEGTGVWMEGEALAQLAQVARLRGCVRAVGMPDLHPGRGIPIGAVAAMRGVLYPDLVGSDAGCGARVTLTALERVNLDRLEARLRSAFEASLFDEVDAEALSLAVWQRGPRAFAEMPGVPVGLSDLATRETEEDGYGPSAPAGSLLVGLEQVLGTIGGGNHFAEVSRVAEVRDEARAGELGAVKGRIVVLVHSGSRGLGAALARAWAGRVLEQGGAAESLAQGQRGEGDGVGAYLGALAGACRVARANRLVLTYRLLWALGALREVGLRGSFDVTHNDVRRETVANADAWVHRKGVAPAQAGADTVVLGSRGTPSWILRGTGSETGLQSVAHGAGRKMKRGEAREKIRARYHRSELERSALGSRVLCDDRQLLLEEHPDAYKKIEPVVAALETHGLATRVASLVPLVTVKL